MYRTHTVITLLFYMTVTGTAAFAQKTLAACADYAEPVNAAIDAGDVDQLEKLLEKLNQANCRPDYLRAVNRSLAQLIAQQAHKLMQQKQNQPALVLLKRTPAPIWMTHYLYGELAMKRRNWAGAVQHYNLAYNRLDDINDTPEPPDNETIQHIRRRANDAQLLAGDLSHSISRGGEPKGVLRPPKHPKINSRGVQIVSFPVPVEFAFDRPGSNEPQQPGFDGNGRANAMKLAAYIKKQTLNRFTLIGHTDERGEADYNRALSERRACALRQFLIGQGVKATIAIVGKGESEPYRPYEIESLTEEEIYLMNRRVELITEQINENNTLAIDCTSVWVAG